MYRWNILLNHNTFVFYLYIGHIIIHREVYNNSIIWSALWPSMDLVKF